MHREIRDHVEDVLAGSQAGPGATHPGVKHMDECKECRAEISGMKEQASLLRDLRAPAGVEAEPRPGFYARVLERIEAEGPVSIWNLFTESVFGRRIAVASLALALLLGVYVITSERGAEDPLLAGDPAPVATQPVALGPVGLGPGVLGPVVLGDDTPGSLTIQMNLTIDQVGDQAGDPSSADAVLANLVTYQEQ